jgi:hypothetical protein
MHASARLHHPVVRFDLPVPTHLVVSVTGDEGDRLRPSLGLVFVLDGSQSMTGVKHQTVIGALRYLSSFLVPSDQVALVSFSSSAKVCLAATKATPPGIAVFSSALDDLTTGGLTDLNQAVVTGISLANQMAREDTDRVVRVIVLTDGQATVGITDPTMITGSTASAHEAVGLSTIGVGLDCNHDLLGLLAVRGGGSYGYVESPEQAGEVIGAEIGGLINLDASRVQVTVAPKNTYLELADPLTGSARRTGDGQLVVALGNLVAGQTRSLVFPATLIAPRRANARPVTAADVTVTARAEEENVTLSVKPKIHFVAGATVRDEAVDEVVDLAILAHAQIAAERAAARKDFPAARDIIRGVSSETLTSSVRVLSHSFEASYSDVAEYASSQVSRNSMSAMLSPNADLVGSSMGYNSLMGRTVGPYTTAAAREVALATSEATSKIQPSNALTDEKVPEPPSERTSGVGGTSLPVNTAWGGTLPGEGASAGGFSDGRSANFGQEVGEVAVAQQSNVACSQEGSTSVASTSSQTTTAEPTTEARALRSSGNADEPTSSATSSREGPVEDSPSLTN